MYVVIPLEITSARIPKQTDLSIAFRVLTDELLISDVFDSVAYEVRMTRNPLQRTEFDDRYESTQVVDLVLEVMTANHSGQVEQFGPRIDFGPKPMFQYLLGLPQDLLVLKDIQMSQYAHNPRESMRLTDV